MKKLNIFKNILFLINFILIIYILFNTNVYFDKQSILLCGLLFILLIFIIKDFKTKKIDKHYNIIFSISQTIILIILLREIFDTRILTNHKNVYFKDTLNYSLYFWNNLIYLNIMYFCLITYRLLPNKKEKKCR